MKTSFYAPLSFRYITWSQFEKFNGPLPDGGSLYLVPVGLLSHNKQLRLSIALMVKFDA